MDLEEIKKIQYDGGKQAELSRLIIQHSGKYHEYHEYHEKPVFAFYIIGLVVAIGIGATFLQGSAFYITLCVLVLLMIIMSWRLDRYRKRRQKLEAKGFPIPTKEELQSYEDANDFFNYLSDGLRFPPSASTLKIWKKTVIKKLSKNKS